MQSARDAAAGDGISAVFSTHVVAELGQVAEHLVVLGRGEVLLSGRADYLTTAAGGAPLEQVILSRLRESTRDHAREVTA
jgi:ABC-type Na+ transport system ATPase subunit NatA